MAYNFKRSGSYDFFKDRDKGYDFGTESPPESVYAQPMQTPQTKGVIMPTNVDIPKVSAQPEVRPEGVSSIGLSLPTDLRKTGFERMMGAKDYTDIGKVREDIAEAGLSKAESQLSELTSPGKFSLSSLFEKPLSGLSKEEKTEARQLSADVIGKQVEAKPYASGLIEGVQSVLPAPKFTSMLERQQEMLTGEQSEEIARARETGKFTAGKWSGVLAGNVALYSAINSALGSLGAESKIAKAISGPLGKVLPKTIAGRAVSPSAISTFLGVQSADLLVDTFAQLPREVYQAIEEEDGVSGFTKQFLKNRAIDIGINLAIGGAVNASKLKSWWKSVDPADKMAGIVRASEQTGKSVSTIQEELGLPRDVTAEQFMKEQEQLAVDEMRRLEDIRKADEYYAELEKQATRGEVAGEPTRPFDPRTVTSARASVRGGATVESPKSIVENLPDLSAKPGRIAPGESIPQTGFAQTSAVRQALGIDVPPRNEMTDAAAEKAIKETLEKSGRELPSEPVLQQSVKSVDDAAQSVSKPIATEVDAGAKGGRAKYRSGRRYVFNTHERNIEDTFGRGDYYNELVVPFFESTGRVAKRTRELVRSLRSNVVDGLGIKPGSAESAAVQDFGEGVKTLDQIKQDFPDLWKKIVDADKWFRDFYKRTLDRHNTKMVQLYGTEKKARSAGVYVDPIDNYYRHMQNLGTTFQKILKTLEKQEATGLRQLDAGISPFAKSRKVVKSFMKRRSADGEYVSDAVGGAAEYIRQIAYAEEMNGTIKSMREWLENWTKKSHPEEATAFRDYMDAFLAGLSGQRTKGTLDIMADSNTARSYKGLLGRVKSNAILGNLSTLTSQFLNIPLGLSKVNDPTAYIPAVWDSLTGANKALHEQSDFLSGRFVDEELRGLLPNTPSKVKKLLALLVEKNDEIATKYIWNSAYRKGIIDGVDDPMKFADELARRSVGGRGIGEIPLIQRNVAYQTFLPFTLEVSNQWREITDLAKQLAGSGLSVAKTGGKEGMGDLNDAITRIITLSFFSHLFAEAQEKFVGYSGIPDLLNPILEFIEAGGEPEDIPELIQGVGAETFTAMPAGALVQSFYPEYGMEIGGFRTPSREQLFGEGDLTRFGTGTLIHKALEEPIPRVLFPYGGSQYVKSTKALKSMGALPTESLGQALPKIARGEELSYVPEPGMYTKDFSRMYMPFDLSTSDKARALAFGTTAIPEVRERYESNQPAFSERQTEIINRLSKSPGISKSIDELTDAILEIRRREGEGDKTLSKDGGASKYARYGVLRNRGFEKDEANQILRVFYGYKTGI